MFDTYTDLNRPKQTQADHEIQLRAYWPLQYFLLEFLDQIASIYIKVIYVSVNDKILRLD